MISDYIKWLSQATYATKMQRTAVNAFVNKMWQFGFNENTFGQHIINLCN